MVSARDRALLEARARGIRRRGVAAPSLAQVLHFDVIISAFGVSVMLLIYYTEVSSSPSTRHPVRLQPGPGQPAG